MKGKILVTINLILILLAITGFSYSHWSDITNIQGTIKIAHRKLIIDSEKVLVPTGAGYNTYHLISYYKTPDKLTLIITCQNVTSDWEIAIGLLIHNNGTLPLNLKETQITIFNNTDGNIITGYFNITTWYYGPFDDGHFNDYAWDGLPFENVPPPYNVTPPITLYHCQHAVTWTLVEPLDPSIDGIDITIKATPKDDPAF